jgi:hypothetical protein
MNPLYQPSSCPDVPPPVAWNDQLEIVLIHIELHLPQLRGVAMSKIKNDKQYEKKLDDLSKEGRHPTEQASERQKRLEGEVADYGQKLHARETKRPAPSKKK